MRRVFFEELLYRVLICVDNGSFYNNIQCFKLGLTPYFKLGSELTRDFAVQCFMFTFTTNIN